MSYPGGNGWPGQPQQPQPYNQGYQQPQPYQQGYQPYQQQPYNQGEPYQPYEQYGGYPGGPQPPKKSKTGLWIAIAALALVIVTGVTLLIVLTGKDDQQAATPKPSPTASSAPTKLPMSSPPSSSTASSQQKVEPTIPDWQGIAAPDEKVAYDVPPDWKVATPGTVVGFENSSGPLAVMHSVGTYKDGAACPSSPKGSYRAHTGMMKLMDIDPRKGAVAGSVLWANAALEKPAEDKSLTPPQAVETKVANGTIPAWTANLTITPLKNQCSAPNMKFTTVTFVPPGQQKTALFVMYGDQQVADALPDAIAQQIIGSLRPYGS